MVFGKFALPVVLAMTLGACGIFSGDGKYAPDEFAVVDRAPLVVPPESDLRPPRPGEPRAQEIDPGQQAYEALFPNAKKPTKPQSGGELAILRNIGPGEPDIRSNVNNADMDVVKKTLLLKEILDADEREYAPDNVSIERVSGR